jgi:hypothetical protein
VRIDLAPGKEEFVAQAINVRHQLFGSVNDVNSHVIADRPRTRCKVQRGQGFVHVFLQGRTCDDESSLEVAS